MRSNIAQNKIESFFHLCGKRLHIFISQNTQKKTGLNTMQHISITITLSQFDKRPLLGRTPPQYIFTLPHIFISHSQILRFFPKNRKCQLKKIAQFLS